MVMKQIEEKRKRTLGGEYNKNQSLIVSIAIKGIYLEIFQIKLRISQYWDIANIINTGFNARS
jgi:hypothetical protein